MASDGNQYLVVWQDARNATADLYGTRVSSAGVVADVGGFAIATLDADEQWPAVVAHGPGTWLVAYHRFVAGAPVQTRRVMTRLVRDTGTEPLGSPCATGAECLSGWCADSVCCNSACGGSDPTDCQACNGSGACTLLTGAICRPATTPCDVAETCGGAAACPTDGYQPDGTSCDDGLVCNGVRTCLGGVCQSVTAPDCDDQDPCTTDACTEPGGCQSAPITGCCSENLDCDDAEQCTVDRCSGPGGTCTHPVISNCCHQDVDCDDGTPCTTDACDQATHRCVHTAEAGCCDSDADCVDMDACTTESCTVATGLCVITPRPGCCNSDGDCDDSDPCTIDTCSASLCHHDPGCDPDGGLAVDGGPPGDAASGADDAVADTGPVSDGADASPLEEGGAPTGARAIQGTCACRSAGETTPHPPLLLVLVALAGGLGARARRVRRQR